MKYKAVPRVQKAGLLVPNIQEQGPWQSNGGCVTTAYSLASKKQIFWLFYNEQYGYEPIKITAEGAPFVELADYRLSDYREI
jgi:hypothetical protein